MTTQPRPNDEPNDSAVDPGLLDEAMRPEPSPDELEARILSLTDPQLLSLLDEALAPEAVPEHLADRIIAATAPGAAHSRDGQRNGAGVLARLGPWAYAAAAAIVLAVGLGLWFAMPQPDPAAPPLAVTPDTNTADWPDSAFASTEAIFESTTLAVEDTLRDAADDLDNITITRDTLWSDFDAYEQFMSDVESSGSTPAT